MNKYNRQFLPDRAGLFTLSLRLVIGWTYFSAFWRRMVLENKLIPDEAGYLGEKFNHFLPNALGIKPVIEYLVSHPDALYVSMVAFTLIEAIVGLLLMLGLFTRIMSVGVFLLAMGILLGSGWLGTTCLDEWQIGILGLAGGFTLFLTGGSAFSFDYYLLKRFAVLRRSRWFAFVGSGALNKKKLRPVVLIISFLIFGLTLFTNQYFHGGVWGKLHNKSVRPKIEISHLRLQPDQLTFEIFRTEGADVYGSFLIGIQLLDDEGNIIQSLGTKDLADFPEEKIHNFYVAKVKPGKYSLVIPLGAKAEIQLDVQDSRRLRGGTLKLIDVSGTEWETEIH